MRCRQPCVQREHARFTAEAYRHQEEYCKHHILPAVDKRHIQCSARHKVCCHTVRIQEEEAHQAKPRAKHGIAEIFHTRTYSLRRPRMDNKRERQDCHIFIGQIHRHHICREAQTHQCPQRKYVKHEKPCRLMLMLHVFHREYRCQKPNCTNQAGKEFRQPICMVCNNEPVRKPPYLQRIVPKSQHPDQPCFHRHYNKYPKVALLFLLQKAGNQPGNQRQYHRKQQNHISVHFPHLILSWFHHCSKLIPISMI